MGGARARGAVLVAAFSLAIAADPPATREPLYSTFSIVARDAATGDLGVAVSTRAPAVGSVVPWARAGVGAVATQAWTNPEFGPKGLELLAQGIAPREALAKLLGEDAQPERRQVGIVDARGVSASHTGRENLEWAGAIEGINFTAQGNLLVGKEPVAAMADSFRSTEGRGLRLTERLLLALEAGQAAGGDKRGRQSAALLVASPDPERRFDRSSNLRVDDHEDPVRELRRLFDTITGRLGYRDLWRPTGPDVSELQRLLRRAGLYQKEPDGIFDDATAEAVQAFRRSQKLYAGEHGGPNALVDAALVEKLKAYVEERTAPAAPGGARP